MQPFKINLKTDIQKTFRAQAVAGQFGLDLDDDKITSFSIAGQIPDPTDDWQIGLIVGPSGSGKSTIARHQLAAELYDPAASDWPADKSVLDGFDEALSSSTITATLTAVGFSSPPDWLKPYRCLSNGQQFRCDLARALLADRDIVAVDEFTSVVDRTVAKVASAAVAKAVRKGQTRCKKFVAVTCHHDVASWLQPDWIYDTQQPDQLARGSLRRPEIKIEIRRCKHNLWAMFSRHHYLDHGLHKSSTCYVATLADDESTGPIKKTPVAFCAVLHQIGKKNFKRISRIVTLPDYQGIGIGSRFLAAVAKIHADQGQRISLTTAHPAMIAHLRNAKDWRTKAFNRRGKTRNKYIRKYQNDQDRAIPVSSKGRPVASFEFCPKSTSKVNNQH